MGITFFIEGAKIFLICVHGSIMALGEVMFLAAVAWVKGGEKGGGNLHIKEIMLLNKTLIYSHLFSFFWKRRHAQ